MNAIGGFFIGLANVALAVVMKLISIALAIAVLVAVVYWCTHNPEAFRTMVKNVGDATAAGINWVALWAKHKTDGIPST